MRLNHLCDLELTYQGELVLVRPYGTEEGAGFGRGQGYARGDHLTGDVEWADRPRRRSDGALQPDIHGVIRTQDGAAVLFTLRGHTVWIDTPDWQQGRQMMSALFEAEAERYRWLNNTLCVAEGKFDRETGRSQIRVFACTSDMQ
jgi:uncharacterized protein DUF3237